MIGSRKLAGILFLFISLIRVLGETTKLEDLEWDQKQSQILRREGKEALAIEGIDWRHAETEHFIYHYSQRWMAERAASEAETYYSWIKKDLKIDDDRWELKGHIFIFEKEPDWKNFVHKTGVDRWSGGVCIGNEIFLLSPPASNPFTGGTLPHEMSHLVINRFVRGRVPVWLNEGFAEQQSRKHFTTYTKPKGFNFSFRPNVVSQKNYLPLEELTTSADYPSDPVKVHSFYTESMRLVQFLIEDHPKQDFLEFLQAMGDGMQFDHAFDRVYGVVYPTLEMFETKFKQVAISKVKLIGSSAKSE